MEKKSGMYSTKSHILQTAINLMEKKGYKGVTTKEIANVSGYSEMTLFRYFGTKQTLLKKAVEKYSTIFPMLDKLEIQLKYDLLTDLMLISECYQKHLEKNKQIELIAVQERNTNPFVIEKTTESMRELKTFLINYFTEMQRQNKMVDTNNELLAMNFIWLNLGFFYTKHFAGNYVPTVSTHEFIFEGVTKFVQGIETKEKALQLQYS